VGSSFISYRGRGFWSHDAFIESFLARLAEASVSYMVKRTEPPANH
jgi:hypothetical protein